MTDFPDIELPDQLGDTSSNVCLDFCLRFLDKPWATIQGCGASLEEAAEVVAGFVRKLNTTAQAMGFAPNCISFSSGACPS